MIRLTGAACYDSIDRMLIESLLARGVLDSSDLGFAVYALHDFADDASVFYSALALVWAARNKHVCIDPDKSSLLFVSENSDDTECEKLRDIVSAIIRKQSSAPDAPFFSRVNEPGALAQSPAVFFGNCLYLNKYFRYQQKIAKEILQRLTELPLNKKLLETGLDLLFSEGADAAQRQAAHAAVCGSCTVISGGPGTGKTSTVIKIALLHSEQLLAQKRTPRIILCAPTGKAALRLQTSLSAASVQYHGDSRFGPLLQWLPDAEHTLTIHRLIPLLSDYQPTLVIVDETSMVDTMLLFRLLTSLTATSSIIFLGDRDQLSSVQSGSVMADLCTISQTPAVHEGRVCVLEKSYRFTQESGIGKAAALIRSGDADGFISFLKSGDRQLLYVSADDFAYKEALRQSIEAMAFSFGEFAAYCSCDDDAAAIELFDRYRILCAHRHGIWGVSGLNEVLEDMLSDEGFIKVKDTYYHNMPLLIQKNDYRRNLFNGDTGLVRRDKRGLRFVTNNDGELRGYNPLFLAQTEKMYAMTIHKSQGSEYDATLTVLPPEDSPLLTRELLYTAITRSKSRAVLLATEKSIRTCIMRATERMSGLSAFLREESAG